jgi:hypothetical protein
MKAGSGGEIQVGQGTKVSGTQTASSEGHELAEREFKSGRHGLVGNGFSIVDQDGFDSLTQQGTF